MQLATLAQLVEQLPRKEQVRSSILLGGSETKGIPSTLRLLSALSSECRGYRQNVGDCEWQLNSLVLGLFISLALRLL
jgi:hypothetical protein